MRDGTVQKYDYHRKHFPVMFYARGRGGGGIAELLDQNNTGVVKLMISSLLPF